MAFPLRQAVILLYLFLISSKEVSSADDHINNNDGLREGRNKKIFTRNCKDKKKLTIFFYNYMNLSRITIHSSRNRTLEGREPRTKQRYHKFERYDSNTEQNHQSA